MVGVVSPSSSSCIIIRLDSRRMKESRRRPCPPGSAELGVRKWPPELPPLLEAPASAELGERNLPAAGSMAEFGERNIFLVGSHSFTSVLNVSDLNTSLFGMSHFAHHWHPLVALPLQREMKDMWYTGVKELNWFSTLILVSKEHDITLMIISRVGISVSADMGPYWQNWYIGIGCLRHADIPADITNNKTLMKFSRKVGLSMIY